MNLFAFHYIKLVMKEIDDIIKDYCGDIEQRIKACRSRDVAELLKHRLCSELKRNCESTMIKDVLIDHVDKLISKMFEKSGNNKYLENNHEED